MTHQQSTSQERVGNTLLQEDILDALPQQVEV